MRSSSLGRYIVVKKGQTMKCLFTLAILVSTVFGNHKPHGSARVLENIPYVIVSDQETISSLFKNLALTDINIGDDAEHISVDINNPARVGRITVSSKTMGGSTLTVYPIKSSEQGFKNALGFWLGKEIVWEGYSAETNPRLYLTMDQIYLYHEKKLDLILVKCKPISEQDLELIKLTREKSMVCLGGFQKESRGENKKNSEKTIPQIVQDKYTEIESKYISEEDKTRPYWRYESELVAVSGVDKYRPYLVIPFYVGIFYAGDGKESKGGYLVLLDEHGEVIISKKGYSRLIGIYDLDRNGGDEILTFWGSGFGGGVELFEIDATRFPYLELESLHRLQTIWD